MRNSILFFFLVIAGGVFVSCDGFVDISPPIDEITSDNLYTDDASALAVMSGIYSQMVNNGGFSSGGVNSVTLLAGRSSDEFLNHSPVVEYRNFSQNTLTVDNQLVRSLWSELYKYIYISNLLMENLNGSDVVSLEVSRQLNGEALFVRAFCYFYLTNMFGDVPLLKSSDYRYNASAPRSSQVDVYDLIVSDLRISIDLLSEEYVSQEKVRPNKLVAKALLARVFLFLRNWEQAELLSSEVINSGLYHLEDDLDSVFLANSTEAIWQLKPIGVSFNTYEGNVFILSDLPDQVSLRPEVVDLFDVEDERVQKWIGSYSNNDVEYFYPYKYKIKEGTELTEYSMVFRLAEQYLIRAEARAMSGKLLGIGGAVEDIDFLRARSGLPALEVSSEQDILSSIEEERVKELFAEWGHRWFDIKRTGLVNEILPLIKGEWRSTAILYPIPLRELQNNRNLDPTPGY
jgi:hypothetical protein